MENNKLKVWYFVEKYFPNYHTSDEIARSNDLSVILEGCAKEGSIAAEIFAEEFDNNIDAVKQAHNESELYILQTAIENFLNSDETRMRNVLYLNTIELAALRSNVTQGLFPDVSIAKVEPVLHHESKLIIAYNVHLEYNNVSSIWELCKLQNNTATNLLFLVSDFDKCKTFMERDFNIIPSHERYNMLISYFKSLNYDKPSEGVLAEDQYNDFVAFILANFTITHHVM